MTDLFSQKREKIPTNQPLAERMRPKSLKDVVGQEHLTGKEGILSQSALKEAVSSFVLWGPPGTGKTTLAKLMASGSQRPFVQISAVFSGVAELRRIFDDATKVGGIVLFVDEIHRFNKAQQDALLGPMESGQIVLIGATTENPSFEINSAILSRARVLTVNSLSEHSLDVLLQRAEATEGKSLLLSPEARECLLQMAQGDARALLNYAETIFQFDHTEPLRVEELGIKLQKKMAMYDKNRDYHYNLISAFIKSMRGSDPDAALYWMGRMLSGGEDPLFLARRMIRFASEDIGLADPQALIHAVAAFQAYERLGSPEGELSLANAVVYLASAPKSNAIYVAFKAAQKHSELTENALPPKHILNAPTQLMKEEGYAKGYQYDHDCPNAFSGQQFFPDTVKRQRYYSPVERGFEREIQKRLNYWEALREEKS